MTKEGWVRFGKLTYSRSTAINLGRFPIFISSPNFLVPNWFSEQTKEDKETKKCNLFKQKEGHSLSFFTITNSIISYVFSLFSSRRFTFRDDIDYVTLWVSDYSPWMSSISSTGALLEKACDWPRLTRWIRNSRRGAQQSAIKPSRWFWCIPKV